MLAERGPQITAIPQPLRTYLMLDIIFRHVPRAKTSTDSGVSLSLPSINKQKKLSSLSHSFCKKIPKTRKTLVPLQLLRLLVFLYLCKTLTRSHRPALKRVSSELAIAISSSFLLCVLFMVK
ncbi:hypothetical protein MRB53_019343 [Persea americana]|uniref:Uncharacterized protein n=1 Tax=Persea americana TaxID=3435 RepID=A0ACC2KXN6_PERAE|nr:hypothetical protein MRB53_019343 [Persea americana]